jgi:hypothetical protein
MKIHQQPGIETTSIYIPRMKSTTTKRLIKQMLEHVYSIGKVTHVDFVDLNTNAEPDYMSAFVYIQPFANNKTTLQFFRNVKSHMNNRLYIQYTKTSKSKSKSKSKSEYYWICLPNNSINNRIKPPQTRVQLQTYNHYKLQQYIYEAVLLTAHTLFMIIYITNGIYIIYNLTK